MQITQVKIRKTFQDSGALRALVSITLDDAIAIHEIKVIESGDRMFVAMPNRKGADGVFRDIVHPVGMAAREELHNTIMDAYIEHLAEATG